MERTGLPYLTIMIDDSASERIADQYEQPETQRRWRPLPGRPWCRRLRAGLRHRLQPIELEPGPVSTPGKPPGSRSPRG